MIGHHAPAKEAVSDAVEMAQGVLDDRRRFRIVEGTRAMTGVEGGVRFFCDSIRDLRAMNRRGISGGSRWF
jgi:hypothetical protein